MHDELNNIIEKFKQENKAIYVNEKKKFAKKKRTYFLLFCLYQIDCRMEVDEIYDDLKNDVLKRI